MRFLVDECTGPGVARWLRENSHDVYSVYDESPGINDDEIIAQAWRERRILITNDRDFGEKIYRDRRPHHGVIFLRLDNERVASKIGVIERLPQSHANELGEAFVVATEKQVRFGR